MNDLFADAPNLSYVRVVPEVALDRMFDYSIPVKLAGKVKAGDRLKVPWGKETVLAYAVEFPEFPEVEKCREIIEITEPSPFIPSKLVELARWMADYYCCDFSLVLKSILPEAVRKKESGFQEQQWVAVVEGLDEEEVRKQLRKTKAQLRVWNFLKEDGAMWAAQCCEKVRTTRATLKALADKGFIQLGNARKDRNPLQKSVEQTTEIELNPDQRVAVDRIIEETQADQPKPILVQGVTGSGKTEVYLQVLGKILDEGKTGLVLVPEIALTPQTVERFRARFENRGVKLAVLHSHLSRGERHDQWRSICSGEARIVIGARSAIFAPLHNLGVIVVDEEHEGSYKQEETPHYHARDMAVMRGMMEKVPVILGTATPSLESFHHARTGKYVSLKLTERATSQQMPEIIIVDLRKEEPPLGHKGRILISKEIQDAIHSRIEKQEQSILYLNRRGFATSVQCPNCGHVEECPHCAVPMTYHRTTDLLKCHLCDYEKPMEDNCPECDFVDFKYAGVGTQRIEDAVAQFFSEARWQRMDSDSMRGKNAYEEVFDKFKRGEIDILLGTQMIAKGLHVPNVTCVGVINCDGALQLPDFRAAERVFQQLVQVAGRAGRGDRQGTVYFQSYTPFHPAIQFARHHDVDGFCESELEYREAHQYPPFSRAVMLTFRGRDEEKTEYCATAAMRLLREHGPEGVVVPEPSPAPIAKLRDHFRYQIFLKTGNIRALTIVIRKHIMPVKWPEGVRLAVDVDPVSLL